MTGDLNLDDKEYRNSTWKESFFKHDLYEGYTWGGDEFYATLVGGKKISPPLNESMEILGKEECLKRLHPVFVDDNH